jgi:cystathionine beta-synthase
MYNDYWLVDQGIIKQANKGDLTDLIARHHKDRATITIEPDDTLQTAYARMKLYDFQQLPVMENETVVGIIDESDILLSIYGNETRFTSPVREAMTSKLDKVQINDSINRLMPIFDRGHVAIVEDGEKFLGLITRYDLLNYLRRRMH